MTDELIHRGRHLHYFRRNGWEFVRRAQAHAVVAIAARTEQDEVVLIEQERTVLGAQGRRVIEIPAGLVGDHGAETDLLAAARRELIEETGFDAEELRIACVGPSSAGLTDELITMVVARGLRRVAAGGGVDGEDIRLHLVPWLQVRGWLAARHAAGMLIDPKVQAGLWALAGD